MSQPIAVDIISDDDDQDTSNDVASTPLPKQFKKPRTNSNSHPQSPPIFVIDDDPTPRKHSVGTTSTPSFVAETPTSESPKSEVSVVKCNTEGVLNTQLRPCFMSDHKPSVKANIKDVTKISVAEVVSYIRGSGVNSALKPESMLLAAKAISPNPSCSFAGINGLICLESDNDSENGSMNETWKQNETMLNSIELTIPLVAKDSNLSSRYIESRLPSDAFREVTQEILTGNVHVAQVFGYSFSHPNSSEDDIVQCRKYETWSIYVHPLVYLSLPPDVYEKGVGKCFLWKFKLRLALGVGTNSDELLSESFKDLKLLVVGVNFLTIEVLFAIAYYHKVPYCPEQEIDRLELIDNVLRPKGKCKDNAYKKRNMDEAIGKRRISKEERVRLKEEKKQQKEQEKLQKEVLRAEAVEMKKLQKERQKWEKGKFALKSIVAEIDPKIVELGSVGGHLLTRFAEKGLTYRITSNPIERSIVWTMAVPEQISQLSSERIEIQYVLLVYEAEEFCNLVMNESLMTHVSCVRSHYPTHTICCLTNRLMAYINKSREEQMRMLGEGFSKLGTLLAKLKTMKRGIEERGKNICMSVHKLGGNKDNNSKDMTIGNVLKQIVNDV
ncbi:unnamed protein product [Ilex paraguariensis]|uniref:ERCC4 domain-containing protein n=2 Tax=Ilex paraguariensis TaxID=185542 RepID=A0ABC8S8Z3_9AQUA